jgi:TonB family protein
MKTRKSTPTSASLKFSLFLQLMILILMVFPSGAVGQQPASGSANGPDEPYTAVDEMPTFPGDNAALSKFISGKIKYPYRASENKIQGKVIVRFCVMPDGSISRVSIIKSVESSLDQEAIRVIKMLPAFNPGKKGGVPVPVWYYLPVSFTLN